MNTLTDLLLGVGQPRVSHFPDLCTLLYTYLSTLDYWTKIVYYLFTQTSPVAHTSALTPTYIKSQKLPNWPISKELGLGRMLLPHWKLLFSLLCLSFGGLFLLFSASAVFINCFCFLGFSFSFAGMILFGLSLIWYTCVVVGPNLIFRWLFLFLLSSLYFLLFVFWRASIMLSIVSLSRDSLLLLLLCLSSDLDLFLLVWWLLWKRDSHGFQSGHVIITIHENKPSLVGHVVTVSWRHDPAVYRKL